MREKNLILKGNICYSNPDRTLECRPDSYVVCVDGKSKGVFSEIPEEYKELPLRDCGEDLIIPGMVDLHIHAPQYTFRGLGMDMELLEWLNVNTFPEEARYANLSYAGDAYEIFTDDLLHSYTTRACIFATLHKDATLLLMDKLEKSGLNTYVGKVNMDRNSSEDLCEESVESAIAETEAWILESRQYQNTKPILTPRFIPSCTDELMRELGTLQKKYQMRVQSHLSENLSEIEWVKELVPAAGCYGEAYDLFNMFGSKEQPAIMAHCVYSAPEEIRLMKERGVYIAHSPESNLNIASGIAPIRTYLEENMHVGLATDMAGGSSISMFHAMELAIQVSKMYWRLLDEKVKPLSFADAFYMATLGGGSYFGKVGSFEPDFEFDALVINDINVRSMRKLTLQERAERMIYQEKFLETKAKYVSGRQVL